MSASGLHSVQPGGHSGLGLAILTARGWRQRACGLLFREKLLPGQALWIHQCRAVHTVGMRYSLSVFFLDAQGKIIRVVRSLPPRSFAACRRAKSVIEMLEISEHDVLAMCVRIEQGVRPCSVNVQASVCSVGSGACSNTET